MDASSGTPIVASSVPDVKSADPVPDRAASLASKALQQIGITTSGDLLAALIKVDADTPAKLQKIPGFAEALKSVTPPPPLPLPAAPVANGIDNPFAAKPISADHPAVGIALGMINIRKPSELARAIEPFGLKPATAVVSVSNYLNMHEGASGYPLNNATGQRLQKIPGFTEAYEKALALAAPKEKVAEVVAVPVAAAPVVVTPVVVVVPPPAVPVVEKPTAPVAAVVSPVPVAAVVPPPPKAPAAAPPVVVAPPAAKPAQQFRPATAATTQPPARAPVQQPKGPNFFEAHYKTRISADDRAADIRLTDELMKGGVTSYDDLLKRRQEKRTTLDVSNNTIKRLRNRAKELGINETLQAGLFTARSTLTPDPPVKVATSGAGDGRYATLQSFGMPQQRGYDDAATRGQPRRETPIAVGDFAKANLDALPHAQNRALRRLMKPLMQMQFVQNAAADRATSGKVNEALLMTGSVSPIVRGLNVKHESERTAFIRDLTQLGAIDGGLKLTPAFAKRMGDVIDWKTKQDFAESQRPAGHHRPIHQDHYRR